jgi:hypothetical protein
MIKIISVILRTRFSVRKQIAKIKIFVTEIWFGWLLDEKRFCVKVKNLIPELFTL